MLTVTSLVAESYRGQGNHTSLEQVTSAETELGFPLIADQFFLFFLLEFLTPNYPFGSFFLLFFL